MPIYLKLGTVRGDSTAKDHVGWIELDSLQIPMSNSRDKTDKKDKKDESGSVLATKEMDSASASLMTLVTNGKALPATIDFVDQDGNIYLQLQLQDVVITGLVISASHDSSVGSRETVTLSFAKMVMVRFKAGAAKDSNDLAEQWLRYGDVLSTATP